MAKYQLAKAIEARKLHRRTELPLSEPAVTIPYSAIIDDLVEDRDLMKFTYLGERYNCKREALRETLRQGWLEQAGPPAAALEPDEAAAAAAEEAVEAPAEELAGPELRWERLNSRAFDARRAKVPGGWLVALGGATSKALTFYPDKDHTWDGASLE